MRKQFRPVAKFQSKRSGQFYIVHESINQLTDECQLTCTCRGWIYNKKCKHIDHVIKHPELRVFQSLTDIPHYNESVKMEWGRNKPETKKWLENHLTPIEL